MPEAHHPLSHHQDDAREAREAGEDQRATTCSMFAYFLEKLRATPDGDGSLLDHMMLLYGCGISDSNQHTARQPADPGRRRRRGSDQGRPPPPVSEGHAAGEPAADAARQDGRAARAARRQHRVDSGIVGRLGLKPAFRAPGLAPHMEPRQGYWAPSLRRSSPVVPPDPSPGLSEFPRPRRSSAV